MATKKGITTIFFHPSLLFLILDPGSGMGKNQDPGSGINILDPQHCARCGNMMWIRPAGIQIQITAKYEIRRC